VIGAAGIVALSTQGCLDQSASTRVDGLLPPPAFGCELPLTPETVQTVSGCNWENPHTSLRTGSCQATTWTSKGVPSGWNEDGTITIQYNSDEAVGRDKTDTMQILVDGVVKATLHNDGCYPTHCQETVSWSASNTELKVVSTSSNSVFHYHMRLYRMSFEASQRTATCGRDGPPTCQAGPWGSAVVGQYCNEQYSVDRGHSLTTPALRHHDLARCKAQCEADPGCTMITVDDHENICVLCQGPLKTLGPNGAAWLNSYVPSGWGGAVVGQYCDEQWSVNRAHSLTTPALRHHDVSRCKAQCLDDPSCTMITVDDHENICVLCQGPQKRLGPNGAAWLNSYVPC
jgi:hypothetical protein